MPIIELHTKMSGSKQIVFDLARSIDLHKISTQQTNERAIAGVTSGLIGMNESVTWRAKHFGIYQNVTSKITEFERPDYFIDEMTQGAFKSFKHQHRFIETKGVTEMIDVFEYKSPFGYIGRLVDYLFLKKYMTSLLVKRNETIVAFAESDRWKEIIPITQ